MLRNRSSPMRWIGAAGGAVALLISAAALARPGLPPGAAWTFVGISAAAVCALLLALAADG